MRPALGDGPTGTMLAGGVAAALYQRERTGRGTTVETSLLQGAMWTLAPDLTSTVVRGEEPATELAASAVGPLLGVYSTADGRWLQLTMPDVRWWGPACRALGLDELLTDPSYDESVRAEHADALRKRFEDAIGERSLADVEASLRAEGCVFAHFASLTDLLHDPQVEPNGYMPAHPTHHTGRLVASPVQFAGEPVEIRRGAPRLGEHSIEVLTEAGFSAEEIDELLESGATAQARS